MGERSGMEESFEENWRTEATPSRVLSPFGRLERKRQPIEPRKWKTLTVVEFGGVQFASFVGPLQLEGKRDGVYQSWLFGKSRPADSLARSC